MVAPRSPQKSCCKLAVTWKYHTNNRCSLKHKRSSKHSLSIQRLIPVPDRKKWHHGFNVWTQGTMDRWKKYHMTNWKFQKEWKGDMGQGWQVDTSLRNSSKRSKAKRSQGHCGINVKAGTVNSKKFGFMLLVTGNIDFNWQLDTGVGGGCLF